MPKHNVALLTGSLRKESYSRKMGRAIMALPAPGLAFSIVEIGDLPLYNEDYEVDPPAPFTRFRTAIAAADAVLFITPEFNRGMPGALKNAIDVGSRPWGKSVWNGKVAAVMSTSTGAVGGFGAHFALRQSLSSVNVATMPHPEAYVGNVASLFDASGKLIDGPTTEFVTAFLASFQTWIDRLRPRSS